MSPEQAEPVHQAVLAQSHGERLEVDRIGRRNRRDHLGQRVVDQEPQHDLTPVALVRPDPAVHRTEGLRQPLRDLGIVGQNLPRQQPNRDQVNAAGRTNLDDLRHVPRFVEL
ncbi:hypothetical protein AB0I34_35590 [Kribbella sp. NPDC050281]|uniref:hypothetical protein n=1 Tax=Kribbella sp. NPDC050281 TaxID=3155515 RepID=UPI0033FD473A